MCKIWKAPAQRVLLKFDQKLERNHPLLAWLKCHCSLLVLNPLLRNRFSSTVFCQYHEEYAPSIVAIWKKILWCERGSVWPDLAIFCLFCNKLKVFGQFLWVLFSIWKNIEPCLAIFYFIGLVNIVRKGQVIKNNLGIWSHWRGYRETYRVERHLVRKLKFVFL